LADKGNVIMQKKSYWSVSPGPARQRTLKASTSLPPPWHTGATDFLAALADSPYAITYTRPRGGDHFPLTLEALQEWDAIILSDIGANTLLLHPDTWLKSRRTANRLTLLHDYVAGGGADDDRRLLQLPGNQRRRALPPYRGGESAAGTLPGLGRSH
jgi:hypothetical protein